MVGDLASFISAFLGVVGGLFVPVVSAGGFVVIGRVVDSAHFAFIIV